MSKPKQPRHPTYALPFSKRAELPHTPALTAYLFRLMARKRTNLCLSADVQSTSQLLDLAEECGDSICVLKTHSDIMYDFGDRTIKGLTEIAARKKFLVFEDRKFGDIGSTVQMQYGAGSHRIASWASIVNAHVFPGPAIITALKSAAFSAVAAYNSTFTTEITGGRGVQNENDESSDDDDAEEESDENSDEDDSEEESEDDHTPARRTNIPNRHNSLPDRSSMPTNIRKTSVVSISTTISSTTEYVSPSGSASSTNEHRAPLSRGLLLLAQMSSKDNLFSPAYTKRCVEMAREHKDFVLGFIAQETLNSAPGDNFLVMTPGVSLPPAHAVPSSENRNPSGLRLHMSAESARTRQKPNEGFSDPSLRGDGLGQQYNTPKHLVLDKGVDVIIVGRGILNAEDREAEAERYRREGWKALMERCGGII